MLIASVDKFRMSRKVHVYHILIFQCGLSWTLYKVSQEHLEKPLVNFSVDLPEEWGMPLGWSLAFVPVLLIIFGFIFHLLWKSRGMPFKMESVRCNIIALSSTMFVHCRKMK